MKDSVLDKIFGAMVEIGKFSFRSEVSSVVVGIETFYQMCREKPDVFSSREFLGIPLYVNCNFDWYYGVWSVDNGYVASVDGWKLVK